MVVVEIMGEEVDNTEVEMEVSKQKRRRRNLYYFLVDIEADRFLNVDQRLILVPSPRIAAVRDSR